MRWVARATNRYGVATLTPRMHGASRYSTRMDLSQMGSELACLIAHLQRKLHVNLKKTTVTHAIHAIAPARGRPSVHHCDGAAITRKRSIPVPPRSTSFAARRTTFRYAQHSAAPDPALQPDHSFTRKRATLRAGRYTPHALERRRGVVRPSAEDQRIALRRCLPHAGRVTAVIATRRHRQQAFQKRGFEPWMRPSAQCRKYIEFTFHTMKPCDREYRFILATTRYAFFLKSML
jgi:hypothetical protein